MAKLKPLKLHSIIGTSTEWTDELWQEALTYLLENTTTPDALLMASILFEGNPPKYYLHKVDYLREFRAYPPTALLGAFDYMRAVKESM